MFASDVCPPIDKTRIIVAVKNERQAGLIWLFGYSTVNRIARLALTLAVRSTTTSRNS